ncbi:HAD family phosphatase [Candidatus Desantisbacteria bacterium]|nr:HAD family phosphatase [Candidatus Desantisbacteria bacterium]
MIKAVILDMDGLMIDTESLYSIALQMVAQKRGKEFTYELKRTIIGKPGMISMAIFKEYLELSDDVAQLLHERETAYGELLDKAELIPMSGLLDLLDLLDNLGLSAAIASSSQGQWIRVVIDKLGIDNRFKAIVSVNDVENGKPYPDIYLLAAKRLGVSPEHCLALEDTPTGMEAARRAGMICVAVPNQYSQGLDFSMADMVIDSLDEVKNKVLTKYAKK